MPSALHDQIAQHFASLGFRIPGTRPTLREALGRRFGVHPRALQRGYLQLPIPDAWIFDVEYRTLVCVEVDITHRANLSKYQDLWAWLEPEDWRLYVVRANHEGLVWPVSIETACLLDEAFSHLEGNPVPVDRYRWNAVLGKHGVFLHWPQPLFTDDGEPPP